MDATLLTLLACPRDHSSLTDEGSHLKCEKGHSYPVVDDIPILLLDDVRQTAWWAEKAVEFGKENAGLRTNHKESNSTQIDPWVQEIIGATSGYLYESLIGNVSSYPIPDIRIPQGSGLFLDVGCNWGRWCVAASRKGYTAIGIDPSLEGVMAARNVARQLNAGARFVVGDARFLPFRTATFARVFSYSVLQHFSKVDAKTAIAEAGRVLSEDGGSLLIQMPNRFGIRSAYHLARRGFSEGELFDVRYWTVPELERTFTELVGPTTTEVDGFFGLGIQPSDLKYFPWHYRFVVIVSEILRAISKLLPPLKYLADSINVRSVAPPRRR